MHLKISVAKWRQFYPDLNDIIYMFSCTYIDCLLRLIWNAALSYILRVNFMFTHSQWETVLLCNDVFHWLGASLESALYSVRYV